MLPLLSNLILSNSSLRLNDTPNLPYHSTDIVLKVKKGTKNVAYMRPLAVEQFEYQDEILFGRGLKYQIQDARIKEGRVLILAEVINDE